MITLDIHFLVKAVLQASSGPDSINADTAFESVSSMLTSAAHILKL